jgi:hypothetical protein
MLATSTRTIEISRFVYLYSACPFVSCSTHVRMRSPPNLYTLATLGHQPVSWSLSVLALVIFHVSTHVSQRLKFLGMLGQRSTPPCCDVHACLHFFFSFLCRTHSQSPKHSTHSLVLPFTCRARRSPTQHTQTFCSTGHRRLPIRTHNLNK